MPPSHARPDVLLGSQAVRLQGCGHGTQSRRGFRYAAPMRRAIRALVLVPLLVACAPAATVAPSSAPISSPSAAATTVTIAITVPVGGENQPAVGAACGLSNIPPAYYALLGANAKVKNESGTLVGAATIPQNGVVKSRPNADEFFDKNCLFEVKTALTGSATFYQLDLGPGIDTKALSSADLEAANWRFEVGF